MNLSISGHMNGIIPWVAFCVWLLSLSIITFARLIHVVVSVSVPPLLTEEYYSVGWCTTLVYLLFHCGLYIVFHSLGLISRVSMNVSVQVFFWLAVFNTFRCIPRSEISGSYQEVWPMASCLPSLSQFHKMRIFSLYGGVGGGGSIRFNENRAHGSHFINVNDPSLLMCQSLWWARWTYFCSLWSEALVGPRQNALTSIFCREYQIDPCVLKPTQGPQVKDLSLCTLLWLLSSDNSFLSVAPVHSHPRSLTPAVSSAQNDLFQLWLWLACSHHRGLTWKVQSPFTFHLKGLLHHLVIL